MNLLFSKKYIIDGTHENSEIGISMLEGFLIKNKDGADYLRTTKFFSDHSSSRWKTEMALSLIPYHPKNHSSITFSSVSSQISEMALRSTDFSLPE
jgi:hypothetical protein